MTKLTKIERIVIDQVPVGLFLVTFEQLWGTQCNPGKHEDCLEHGCMDNEPSYVAEIMPDINLIDAVNYLSLDADVLNKDETWNSDKLWQDDTHDLRPRLFKSKEDVEKHIKYTLDRFNNPQPWENFIKSA